MSINEIIEQKIREAMERGDFDNLPGRGRPQDHNAYFSLPEDIRMGYTVLQNAGYLPQEVQLLRDIARLRERLADTRDERARHEFERALRDKQMAFDIMMERRQRRPRRGR